MRTHRRRTIGVLAALSLGAAVLAFATGGPAAGQSPPPPSPPSLGETLPPPPPPPAQAPAAFTDARDGGGDVADGDLRQAVDDLAEDGTTDAEVEVVGERVRVEILHHTTDASARALVQAHGGTVDGSVPGVLLEALVPADEVEALESEPAIDVVRPPVPVNEPLAVSGLPASGSLTGEEVAKTRADIWQLGGQTGAGVKIGIIDFFDGTTWDDAEASGDVPHEAGTFCRVNGATCDAFSTFSSDHGVAVAEILHDMAPSAELYLGVVNTTSDMQALVDWFDSQGVDIISRSQGTPYDSPGDGTGPVDAVIDNAVADGMAWFQAAGNHAGDGGVTRYGSYYRWTYADADNDGAVEVAPGEEALPFWCGYQEGLRWNDFGEGTQASDYDMYVYDPAHFVSGEQVDMSLNDQTAGALPIERTLNCVPGWNYLVVYREAGGATSVGDTFEFSNGNSGLARSVNAGSASLGGVDQKSTGALTVGAIDPPSGTTIGVYSSQGPTNDGRVKPDISAAACVQSVAFAPNCFAGTSAATPVVAGAAALVLDSGVVSTPAALRTWLLCDATAARGSPGIDNVYGVGELVLPTPLPPPTRVCRPDARIRTSTNGPIKGDNVISATAGPQQTVTRTGGSGANLTYTATFQNDNRTAERFRIQGTASTTKFTVTYRVGGTNVTSAVVAGAYQTSVVAPGGAVTMSITVKVKSNTVRNNAFTGKLTARSTIVPSIVDAVKFTARRV